MKKDCRRRRERNTTSALLAGATLLLASCADPGDIRPAQALLDAGVHGATQTTTPWPAADWWAGYGDATLNTLVERAVAGAPGLQLAQARLQRAQAAVDATDAARAPQVLATLDMDRQQFTGNGLFPPPLAGATKWNNTAQIGAAWEWDLFGRQRAALDAAIGQQRAAVAETQAARVFLSASVVAGYFNLARLVEARELARQALVQREQVLALVRPRVAAGLDTNVELRQSEGLIAQARVDIESLDESLARARHALAELSGQGPQALGALAPAFAALHAKPLPAGLPADLLGRRADLVAQRWRVEAALREVDEAHAQFYPNINLVALVGLSSIGLDNFVEARSLNYMLGPALRLPIFAGDRLRANLSAKSADTDAAVDAYNAALLRALREVADELSSLQSLERQQRFQAEATAAADAAYALAVQRYQAGLGNFLIVLAAQTNMLAQQRAATELKARHLGSEVALARALGGGYDAADTLPAPPMLATAH
jgi:NodT family efflux transporter outer membrane factor (OMF) lipoprotein